MKLRLIICIVLATLSIEVKAQDPIFTQFYLAPETLNPAYTGTLNTWYAGIIHRSQWPDGNRKLNTEYAFLNGPLDEDGKMGLGLTLLNHHEVFTNYNYFQINTAFAYDVELSDYWKLRMGLEAGYGNKNFNFGNLLLEDQININNGTISAGSVDPYLLNYGNKINFFDISSGLLIYSDDAWFGASIKHLNRPDISFVENGNFPLDMFLSVHGGYAFKIKSFNFMFNDESKFLLTGNYMRQSQFNRLDLGGALEFDKFTFGVISVTNPERRSENSHLLTSINIVSSIQLDDFVFGYSYDINTSRLGNTHGVHELSLTWQIGRTCSYCNNYLVKKPWGRNYKD
jgi:type IX secretion system PorP/SprF family membrane protein